MTSVLVTDDQALLRAGLRGIVDTAPDLTVVAEAGTGHQAISAVQRTSPDVVLMDIRMPGMDGLQATKVITASTRARVLILTTFDLDDYVYGALRAGASGFLLKDAAPAGLLDAIRVVAAGDALLAPSVTRRLIRHFAAPPVPAAAAHCRQRSPNGNGKSWRWWPKDCRTRKSRPGCTSALAQPRPT